VEEDTMGDSQVMTHTRDARDEELLVSEVEVATLPRASETTPEPSEGEGSGGGEEEEQVKWQGGPNDPPGSGSGGSSGGSGS
jgi:hypothetical protein